MSSSTCDVVVIGGGPAGMAAAIEAARAGAGVTMVLEEPAGGRATHSSLLPSKVWLHVIAERAADLGRPNREELASWQRDIDDLVRARSLRDAERLEQAGVAQSRGVGRFVSAHELEIARVDREPLRIRFDRAVIATGSVPFFPPGFLSAPLDGQRVLAPRHLRTMTEVPASILVVGGGASGAEAVASFQAIGVETTWILDDYGILPAFDRELADSLGDVLMERGVRIVHGRRALDVRIDPSGERAGVPGGGVLAALEGGRTYSAAAAYVAIGRRADCARLEPEAAGVEIVSATGAVRVDRDLTTTAAHVFAAGDAAGPPYLANKASLEGWVAGRRAVGRPAEAIVREAIVEAVYTDPEVAIVGLTAERARRAGRDFEVRTIAFDESLRGVFAGVGLDPHARGVLRVVLDVRDRTILGASAIGPGASEILGPIAIGIRTGATLESLAATALASPTLSELGSLAAR